MQCPLCEKPLSGGQSKLKRHIERVHFKSLDSTQICDSCGQRLRNKQSFSRHKNHFCKGVPPKIRTKISSYFDGQNYVCECGGRFSAISIPGHFSHCSIHSKSPSRPSPMKGRPSKFRGKKLEEIVKDPVSTREKLSRASIGRKPLLSEKALINKSRKLSEARLDYLSRSPYIKWHEVGGISVQGNWERQVAEKLLADGIKFERVRLPYCKGARHYVPDFFLPELNLYIEVKGWYKDEDKAKYRVVLSEQTQIDLRIILGKRMLAEFVTGNVQAEDLPRLSDTL